MNERNDMPVRRTGKVLLVNAMRELLLFRADERMWDGTSREIWFPVGGGAEEDETYVQCAARELFEETGLRVAVEQLGKAVGTRAGAFVFDGVPTWSDEVFFFLTVPEWDVDESGFTDLERTQLVAHRWWPLAELASTDRTIFPSGKELAALISTILISSRPEEPVEFSWDNPPGWPRINTTLREDF